MLFPEPTIAARVLPADLAQFVTGYYREKGVEVLTGETVESVQGGVLTTGPGARSRPTPSSPGSASCRTWSSPRPRACRSTTASSSTSTAASTGATTSSPQATWRTSRCPRSASTARVEHEDHAITHGKRSARTWRARASAYDHLPFFYSDLFDLGYEAVGDVDARLETVERWDEPNRKGVVAYVDDERRPRGFLLWNTWDKVDAARELIRAAQPVDEGALV